MKIIFLSSNDIAFPLYHFLKDICNEDVRKLSKGITLNDISILNPDMIISYNYRYIIEENIINFLNGRIINLHISYLPWNRGADPNLWSFIDNTPKGVTVQLIDKGVDTGDILLQKEINIDEDHETLASSYRILHLEMQNLFIDNWLKIKSFSLLPRPQSQGGSFHFKKDFSKIRHILGEEEWNLPIFEFKNRVKKIMQF